MAIRTGPYTHKNTILILDRNSALLYLSDLLRLMLQLIQFGAKILTM